MRFIYDNFDLLFDKAGSVDVFRKLILEMAVRGKLVPQDPNDEHASILIGKIKKEKEKLIKDGILKKEKPMPPVKEDETPYTLPNSWKWVRLKEIGYAQTGTTPSTKIKDYYNGRIPFIKPGDISDEGIEYQNESLTELGLQKGRLIKKDSVMMVCIGGSIGKSFYTIKDASCNQQINTITGYIGISGRFINYFISAPFFENEILNKATGSATPIINKEKWGKIVFPLPPLNEQKRIVQKIDEIFEMIPKFQEALEQRENYKRKLNQTSLNTLTNNSSRAEFIKSVQFVVNNFDSLYDTTGNIKELRQAILTLAVQGKLVPQDPNDVPVFESYNDLLHKINTLLKKNKKNIKYSQAIDYKKHQIRVHENWRIAKLCHIADFIDYRGRTPQKTSVGIPLITAKNIKLGYMSQEPREYISEYTYNSWMTRGMPSKGDILFTTEAPLGNVCQVDIDGKFALAQRAIAFKLINVVEPSFLKYLLMSNAIQGDIYSKATGTTAKGIKASRLKEVIIPIPPLNEQKRIVQKIDKCMALCDVLENRIAECSSISDQLLDTVIHEAFVDVS